MKKIPKNYYLTPHWKRLSKEVLNNKILVCEVCGRPRWKLLVQGKNKGKYRLILHFNLHHKHYNHLGAEKKEDLMALCKQCHEICHAAIRTRHMSPVYEELAKFVESKGFVYTSKE